MKYSLPFACAFTLLFATTLTAITFEQRLEAQRSLEHVYDNHRIWPKENPGARPPLEVTLPEASLRAKVEDYLRKSDALERYWERPITAQQLQAEMDRMAKETKQPVFLRELFAALGNDPQLIAECLARPILADRFIHHMYSGDGRVHGVLKRQVESELAITNTLEAMRALSGSYSETIWKKTDNIPLYMMSMNIDGSILLDTQEWTDWTGRLQQYVPGLQVMKISRLLEDEERYYVIVVLQKEDAFLRLATVEWKKQTFDEWWSTARQQVRAEIAIPDFAFALSYPSLDSLASTDSWFPTDASAPTPRGIHVAVWTGTEMIIWGGRDFLTKFNTGGRYLPSTNTWAAGGTSTIGAPTERAWHTAVWTGTEMIVWGGYDGGFLNTGGRYNPSTNTWAEGGTSTKNAPTGRNYHSAVWTGTEMIVWGGHGNGYLNTGGRYDPSTNTWAAGGTSAIGAPTGRMMHTAVWTKDEMIVWGGAADHDDTFKTGGRYDPSTDTWTAGGISTTHAPIARCCHTAVWTGREMIIWGGWWYDGNIHIENTGGRYSPYTDTWERGGTSIVKAPRERIHHSAVWTGAEMIIWGGIGSADLNTGGRYNPSTNQWAAGGTTTANAPTARYSHRAVWTGAEMIVWGGVNDIWLNTGGVYSPGCLFCDDFEDGILANDWAYSKPAWNETGGSLVATPTGKAIAVATPAFTGCRTCSIEVEMKTEGGVGNALSLLAWYVDKNNTMELQLKEETDKIVLKQRVDNTIVKRQDVSVTINSNQVYRIKIAFDGSQFDVSVDSVHMLSMVSASPVPTGTVGFLTKNTVGTFGFITVQ